MRVLVLTGAAAMGLVDAVETVVGFGSSAVVPYNIYHRYAICYLNSGRILRLSKSFRNRFIKE